MSKRGNGATCVLSGDGKDEALKFIAKAKARAALAKRNHEGVPSPEDIYGTVASYARENFRSQY